MVKLYSAQRLDIPLATMSTTSNYFKRITKRKMEHTKLPCCSISPTIKYVYASQHEILVTALVNECCVKLIVIIRAISVNSFV